MAPVAQACWQAVCTAPSTRATADPDRASRAATSRSPPGVAVRTCADIEASRRDLMGLVREVDDHVKEVFAAAFALACVAAFTLPEQRGVAIG